MLGPGHQVEFALFHVRVFRACHAELRQGYLQVQKRVDTGKSRIGSCLLIFLFLFVSIASRTLLQLT